jgi:HSP20 family protein
MSSALLRWDRFGEFADLRTRLDRMFDELSAGGARGWTPMIDLERDDGDLVLRADIPGIRPEEVKIEIEDDVLTVSGEHEERDEKKEKDFIRRERRFGAFSRSVVLPAGVEAKKVKAETHDGVLEVRIPLPEAPKKETVTIKPAG